MSGEFADYNFLDKASSFSQLRLPFDQRIARLHVVIEFSESQVSEAQRKARIAPPVNVHINMGDG
jgi:hypothetical protein